MEQETVKALVESRDRAEQIYGLLEDLSLKHRDATAALRKTLSLLDQDYPHNDQALTQALGAHGLVGGVLSQEVANWRGYLIARQEQLSKARAQVGWKI